MFNKFLELHEFFLDSLQSNDLILLTDDEIATYLNKLIEKGIARFRFPNIDLSYDRTDFTFKNAITMREAIVILAFAKVFWLEKQLDNDSYFTIQYFDRDVKTFSTGEKLKVLRGRLQQAIQEAEQAEYDYYTVDTDGTPTIGNING